MITADEIAERVHPGDGPIARDKRESLARNIQDYARQSCQATFEDFMALLPPIMKGIPKYERFQILAAIAKTNPVTP